MLVHGAMGWQAFAACNNTYSFFCFHRGCPEPVENTWRTIDIQTVGKEQHLASNNKGMASWFRFYDHLYQRGDSHDSVENSAPDDVIATPINRLTVTHAPEQGTEPPSPYLRVHTRHQSLQALSGYQTERSNTATKIRWLADVYTHDTHAQTSLAQKGEGEEEPQSGFWNHFGASTWCLD